MKILVVLKYCHDKYKTQVMCDKAVDACLLSLKFVPDWFVRNQMSEKLDNTVFPDDYIAFGSLDSDFAKFFSEDTSPNSITFDNTNLGDKHFDFCDLENISHVRNIGWYNKYK